MLGLPPVSDPGRVVSGRDAAVGRPRALSGHRIIDGDRTAGHRVFDARAFDASALDARSLDAGAFDASARIDGRVAHR